MVKVEPPKSKSSPSGLPIPRLNIVIQVVGSRGDVQPFVALGKTLKEQHHHRIRLATHSTFKGFVEENGLEFFNIGGDPAKLMAFMVKNPGLVPGIDSLRHGDVGKRQKEIFDILLGCWRSCIESGDGMDNDLFEDTGEDQPRPFVADAIIANPPSFAHIHCAEKLGIPLHLMFTMPWSPTHVFPHPLANINSSNADPNVTNLVSYTLVEALTWQGLGHIINRFRKQNLRLEPVSLIYAPSLLNRLHIPYTYCWSPALIPKPKDWGQHISISGFYFLSLASTYQSDMDLQAFLDAGPPPIYVGFGSIVVDDPDAMTTMIFSAVEKAGVRALVSKGWGGLGKGDIDPPRGIYMLGNVPHDWLFQRVSCVVHHGGAGTTAAGIALGKPTVVVPFFGDQPFWGAMIARAGAGPVPVPYKHLTADILAASITEALQPSVLVKSTELAASIAQERGTQDGAMFFHNQLNADSMRCSLSPDRVAVWRVRRTQIRLSGLAAAVLQKEGVLEYDDLKLYRPREYNTLAEPSDPLSGVAAGVVGSMGDFMVAASNLPVRSVEAVRGIGAAHRRHSKPLMHPLDPFFSSQTLTISPSVSSEASTLIPEYDEILKSPSIAETPSMPEGKGQIGSHRHGDLDTMETKDTDYSGISRSSANHRLSSRLSSLSTKEIKETCVRARAPIGPQDMHNSPGTILTNVIGGTIRSPMDLTLTLARGFNNAPKLYGDSTVRQPDKVVDLQSGIKMAGKVHVQYARFRKSADICEFRALAMVCTTEFRGLLHSQ